jgi:hypothetical protein
MDVYKIYKLLYAKGINVPINEIVSVATEDKTIEEYIEIFSSYTSSEEDIPYTSSTDILVTPAYDPSIYFETADIINERLSNRQEEIKDINQIFVNEIHKNEKQFKSSLASTVNETIETFNKSVDSTVSTTEEIYNQIHYEISLTQNLGKSILREFTSVVNIIPKLRRLTRYQTGSLMLFTLGFLSILHFLTFVVTNHGTNYTSNEYKDLPVRSIRY